MAKKPIAKKQNMDRFPKEYSPEEVFAWIKASTGTKENPMPKRVPMDGHGMKVYSLRYENFMAHGTKCCVCGIEGTKFYKERNHTVGGKPTADNGEYHFNLYATEISTGDEILMTKDHIIAKAHGGADTVENMQPMCTVCNGTKGFMTTEQWDEFQRTGEYPEDYQQALKHDNTPHLYEDLKALADQHGKQVYVFPTLNNRLAIAVDLKDADKKFIGHKGELYIP